MILDLREEKVILVPDWKVLRTYADFFPPNTVSIMEGKKSGDFKLNL